MERKGRGNSVRFSPNETEMLMQMPRQERQGIVGGCREQAVIDV